MKLNNIIIFFSLLFFASIYAMQRPDTTISKKKIRFAHVPSTKYYSLTPEDVLSKKMIIEKDKIFMEEDEGLQEVSPKEANLLARRFLYNLERPNQTTKKRKGILRPDIPVQGFEIPTEPGRLMSADIEELKELETPIFNEPKREETTGPLTIFSLMQDLESLMKIASEEEQEIISEAVEKFQFSTVSKNSLHILSFKLYGVSGHLQSTDLFKKIQKDLELMQGNHAKKKITRTLSN